MAVSKMNKGNFLNTEWTQTHVNVSIPLSSNNVSSFMSCDGYDKIAVHLSNDGATSSSGDIEWSFDGITQTTYDAGVIASNTTQKKTGLVDVKAPYVRFRAYNNDATASHTMSAWVYFK